MAKKESECHCHSTCSWVGGPKDSRPYANSGARPLPAPPSRAQPQGASLPCSSLSRLARSCVAHSLSLWNSLVPSVCQSRGAVPHRRGLSEGLFQAALPPATACFHFTSTDPSSYVCRLCGKIKACLIEKSFSLTPCNAPGASCSTGVWKVEG